jgi:hypothetical protein
MPSRIVMPVREGLLRRGVIPALGLAVLALLALLYCYDTPLYLALVHASMMRPYVTPFIDAVQIPALIACWRQGVDVFVSAPCDPFNRALAYSPLWLRVAGFVPTDLAWLNTLGLILDGTYFLSLALLPPLRRKLGFVLLALAVFSSLPGFALERGNMDVVMFVLAALGGWLCCRPWPLRLLGYPFFTLAGLLKFYPLVLFLLFLRERLVVFLLLCFTALGVLVGFVLLFEGELAEMARNLPSVGYYKDSFGARQFPFGLGPILQDLFVRGGVQDLPVVQALDPAHSVVFMLDMLGLMVVLMLIATMRLAARAELRAALEALATEERVFLVIGAVLICGCFFAGQNQSYRGIHLVFVMPALIALATEAQPPKVRSLFRWLFAPLMLVLWGLSLQQLVAWLSGGTDSPMGGSAAMDLYWIIHEIAWWWLIAVLLGVLFCFVADSPVWRSLSWRRARTA